MELTVEILGREALHLMSIALSCPIASAGPIAVGLLYDPMKPGEVTLHVRRAQRRYEVEIERRHLEDLLDNFSARFLEPAIAALR